MAPITWGPRICVPPPPVPTAPGGFEDLRKGKEKLALTLQNNPAWVGWGGEPHKEASVGGGSSLYNGSSETCPWGETEDLYQHGLRKKCLYSFRTCPHRLQAKNVQHSIY